MPVETVECVKHEMSAHCMACGVSGLKTKHAVRGGVLSLSDSVYPHNGTGSLTT